MELSDLSDALQQHHHHYDGTSGKYISETPLIDPFIFMHMFPSFPVKLESAETLDWKSFELCLSVNDGVETKLLIYPVLDGYMAAPMMSTLESEKCDMSVPLLRNTYDCRNYDESNIDHILRGLTVKLILWQNVMKFFNLQNMSKLSENDITGTLVMRRTILRGLELYEPLTQCISRFGHDSNACIAFIVNYIACKERCRRADSILSGLCQSGKNAPWWKSALDEIDASEFTTFEEQVYDLVLCRVGPTGEK
jgi:hypothetical protein